VDRKLVALTKDFIEKKLSDLENEYVDFLLKHFAEWKSLAQASQRLLGGETVREEEVPTGYILEFRMLREVLKMEAAGKFDWNNPALRECFEQFVTSDYYKLWGKTITRISLRLAAMSGAKTLVEIGAGRGNLTEIMVKEIAASREPINFIVTDVDPIILESMQKLKNSYPHTHIEALLWDIKKLPPEELIQKIQHPCLIYERASIMYTNIPAIKNMARIADSVVLGDMFNYTGELYAYDEINKKIGGRPLFYSEIKPIVDECFREHFMFDVRAQQVLKYPSTTILIAWK
jgi:hypothetical protein